jgi:hypothetical protein
MIGSEIMPMAITEAATGAGDGAQDGAHDDDGVGQPARHLAEELPRALQQVLGEAAALQDGAHQGEEGDGEQEVVGQDAEDPQRQVAEIGHGEEAELDGQEAEEQPHRAEREGDGKADQQEDHQPAEHQRRHYLEAHGVVCPFIVRAAGIRRPLPRPRPGRAAGRRA